jgi:hypothetical protein
MPLRGGDRIRPGPGGLDFRRHLRPPRTNWGAGCGTRYRSVFARSWRARRRVPAVSARPADARGHRGGQPGGVDLEVAGEEVAEAVSLPAQGPRRGPGPGARHRYRRSGPASLSADSGVSCPWVYACGGIQITRFGAPPGGHLGDKVVDHIGGYVSGWSLPRHIAVRDPPSPEQALALVRTRRYPDGSRRRGRRSRAGADAR